MLDMKHLYDFDFGSTKVGLAVKTNSIRFICTKEIEIETGGHVIIHSADRFGSGTRLK